MTERKSPSTDEELVQAIADLFNEIEPETPEEIEEVLREAGHNPDEVAAQLKAVAEHELAKSPLNWRNRAPKEVAEDKTRLASFAMSSPKNRMEMIAAIRALQTRLGGAQGGQISAHFRNFEEATDEDLRNLLTQLEYLAGRRSQNTERTEE